MSLKSVFLLVTVLITCANSEEIKDNGFIIVSTTQRPSDPVVTTSLEKQLEFCTKVNEESRQQFGKIQKMLEEQLKEQQKRNEALIQKSLEKDQQISEIQKKLDALQKRNQITDLSLPKNCKEVMERGNNSSGIYLIRPKHESFGVLCDMASRGGGWTVFQNRIDGSQDFYLDWEDYKRGFGNLSREFWLGLEHLHQLTGNEERFPILHKKSDGDNELLVILVDYQHKEAYANYKYFSIGSEEEGFLLKLLGDYYGTAGNSLANHLGSKFATKDRDQDNPSRHCATAHGGAWWFKGKINCLWSNLNGKFLNGSIDTIRGTGINWYHFSTDDRSLLAAKMMARPK